MTSGSIVNAATERKGFGRGLRTALIFPCALFIACLAASAFFNYQHLETGVIAASFGALIAAAIAIVLVIRRPALRKRRSVALTAFAFIAGLPALSIAAFIVFMFLPVTYERDAIALAETFVSRNGYTSTGHPTNLRVVSNDFMESGSAEKRSEDRRNTLQPRAIGIIGLPLFGYRVAFEFTHPAGSSTAPNRRLFVVNVETDGTVYKPHMMPLTPVSFYKRNKR